MQIKRSSRLGRCGRIKGFQTFVCLRGYLDTSIQHVTSEHFIQQWQSGTKNQNNEIYDSITTHISGSIPFVLHAKWMTRLYFITYIFLKNGCIIWNFLTNIRFLLQTTVLGAIQDRWSFLLKLAYEMKTFEKGCNNLWITELRISWSVAFKQFFLKLLFF
jgi:hypothetical protein